MTHRSAIIFAVLVTACLAAITANLYDLRQRMTPKPTLPSVTNHLSGRDRFQSISPDEAKKVWPEGWVLFLSDQLTIDEFYSEARIRVLASREEKP